MSAPWKAHMTYNRYASIAASAVRSALKPEQHAKAVRRGEQTLKYQDWKDGKGSDSAPVAEGIAKAVANKAKAT